MAPLTMTERPTILATRRFPDAVERRLARDYRARLNPDDRLYDRAGLIAAADGADGLFVSATEQFDAGQIARLPASVAILGTLSVGLDHIDLDAARARGLVITHTPDVLSEACADTAMLLLLAAARRAREGDTMVRDGSWTGWAPTQLLGVELNGKRLGILGMGRIGQALARRARGFGLEVHYCNRHRLPADREQGAVYHADADEMVGLSHFLSLNCPATPETIGFLDAARIARLPDGAVVVNISRGELIDEAALIAALKSGKLAGAGLDVFDGEPKVNAALRALPNTFLFPHAGSATVETRDAMGMMVLDSLDAFFAGHDVPRRAP